MPSPLTVYASADCTIGSAEAWNGNYDGEGFIALGDAWDSRSDSGDIVLKFDLSSIPSTATVTAASLELYEYAAYDTGAGSCSVYRLLRNWVEAGVNWQSYDWTTGKNWTTAGAASDGNDRDADVSATLTLDGTSANGYVAWSGATLTDDVQKMVNGTYAANYGWIIVSAVPAQGVAATRGNRFYDSENATESLRPKLVVTYTEVSTIGVRIRRLIG